jgi:hypothetical protein
MKKSGSTTCPYCGEPMNESLFCPSCRNMAR